MTNQSKRPMGEVPNPLAELRTRAGIRDGVPVKQPMIVYTNASRPAGVPAERARPPHGGRLDVKA